MTDGQSQSMTIDWFFRQAWRWVADMPEESPKAMRPPLELLRASQWNRDFEQLMRNRLVMGAFRYGTFAEQTAVRHDNARSMRTHLDAYTDTGNAEHLVDIANLALVEFTLPSHSHFHFRSIDDGQHHARRVR